MHNTLQQHLIVDRHQPRQAIQPQLPPLDLRLCRWFPLKRKQSAMMAQVKMMMTESPLHQKEQTKSFPVPNLGSVVPCLALFAKIGQMQMVTLQHLRMTNSVTLRFIMILILVVAERMNEPLKTVP
jgi:hypothetical protein